MLFADYVYHQVEASHSDNFPYRDQCANLPWKECFVDIQSRSKNLTHRQFSENLSSSHRVRQGLRRHDLESSLPTEYGAQNDISEPCHPELYGVHGMELICPRARYSIGKKQQLAIGSLTVRPIVRPRPTAHRPRMQRHPRQTPSLGRGVGGLCVNTPYKRNSELTRCRRRGDVRRCCSRVQWSTLGLSLVGNDE